MADSPNPTVDAQTLAATRSAAAAALAGGMIAASGRPHSIEQALELHRQVYFAMFPAPGHGTYEAWKNDPDRLTKVHS